MTDKKQKRVKKVYRKPEIQVIDLAADEVMAVGCKTPTSDLKGTAASCFLSGCTGIGS